MLTAQGIERMMMGLIHRGGGPLLRLCVEGHHSDNEVQDQVAPQGQLSQNIMEFRVGCRSTFVTRVG